MSLFGKLFSAKQTRAEPQEEGCLCAPFSGTVIPLEQFPDAVFNQGVMGNGCGIEPEEETVCSPCAGVISQLTPTNHAVGITGQDGAEILIHVGVDTVEMNGQGFSCLVRDGQKVKVGTPLLTFNRETIRKAGHPCTTALVVTNSDDFSLVELLVQGPVCKGQPVLKVDR